jgi:hypothetical protein
MPMVRQMPQAPMFGFPTINGDGRFRASGILFIEMLTTEVINQFCTSSAIFPPAGAWPFHPPPVDLFFGPQIRSHSREAETSFHNFCSDEGAPSSHATASIGCTKMPASTAGTNTSGTQAISAVPQ